MKTTSLLLLIISIFLFGCKDNREQTTETLTEPNEAIQQKRPNWENDIQLNNGSQWLVKNATTEGVQRMKKILENDSSGSIEEYRELGNELYEEQNKLERHTEHAPTTKNMEIYLAPLEEKIELLQRTGTSEEGARLKSDLKQHLDMFTNYFVQTGMNVTN